MKNLTGLLLVLVSLYFISCVEDPNEKTPSPLPSPPVGLPTEVGLPIGESYSEFIGPNGGTISWGDGKYSLFFPKGAVDQEILIDVQPIAHTLQHGLGTAFDFGPDGTVFKKPVELVLTYNEDELLGTGPEWVHVAYQDEKNVWQAMRNLEVNTTQKTIKAKLSHFSRWAFFASAIINPGHKSLNVSQTVELEVMGYEYELSLKENPKYWDLLAPLVPPSLIQGRLVKEWLIDGKTNGAYPEKGTILPISSNLSRAQYKAPLAIPDEEKITVSAELNLGKGKFLLLSYINIQNQNSFKVGPYQFTNTETIVGMTGNTLVVNMAKTKGNDYEAVAGFSIPNFKGVGNYPFSKETNGGVGILEADKTFHSTAYNEKSEPYFNGYINITQSSNQVGGIITGTMGGTLYETVESNGKVSFIPNPFQATFSTVINY